MSMSLESARSPGSLAGATDSRRERQAREPWHNAKSKRRELAHRSGAGVDVTLYWHPTFDELIVCVYDKRHGAHFEIRPAPNLALDVYYHPYAYADLEYVYEKENRHVA
jgi:hypothetical protein